MPPAAPHPYLNEERPRSKPDIPLPTPMRLGEAKYLHAVAHRRWTGDLLKPLPEGATPEQVALCLGEDSPKERLPGDWCRWGPGMRGRDTYQPRVFMGLVPWNHKPGGQPEVLHILTSGGSPDRERYMSWKLEIPDSVQDAVRKRNVWVLDLLHARGELYACPKLRTEQEQLLVDAVLAMRGFSEQPEGGDERYWAAMIPQEDWPEFWRVLSDGVPHGEYMRAEHHLARFSTWLRARYPAVYAPLSAEERAAVDEPWPPYPPL
ncbi:hypothetical protein OH76DRAFT_1486010 [Lentinus brumalis]|uniref:Uncharacterized protein n=1 Tax=Lentinus brumalis TaxID=2498619 RepID=A0A371CZZ9_9APHY|nr:hypothetical protein OH76DRAFT_1486010 [Polyporus brumalis]